MVPAKTTYELTTAQVKTLICKELGVEEDKVTVTYQTRKTYSGPYDSVGTTHITGLTVEVKP